MNDFLQFALLGIGAGSIYALAAQGIVVIYRGSGVLNFSQGALGLLAAAFFVDLWYDHGWPLWPTAALAVLLAGITGALVYLLVMRPLRDRSPLVRGPYVSLSRAFAQGASIEQLVRDGVLHPHLARVEPVTPRRYADSRARSAPA